MKPEKKCRKQSLTLRRRSRKPWRRRPGTEGEKLLPAQPSLKYVPMPHESLCPQQAAKKTADPKRRTESLCQDESRKTEILERPDQRRASDVPAPSVRVVANVPVPATDEAGHVPAIVEPMLLKTALNRLNLGHDHLNLRYR